MPDTWPTPRVWVASERVSASKMNEISTGLRVLYPVTAGGDVTYRDPAGDYLTRLAKPSADSVLKNTSGGVPSWLGLINLKLKTATLYNATGHTYNSTTERDMPNSSGSITVDVTSTILVFARIYAANASGNCWTMFAVSIDGTTGNFSTQSYGGPNGFTTPAFGRKTGVAAGTRTIKLREKEGYGAGLSYTVGNLEWFAIAIPE